MTMLDENPDQSPDVSAHEPTMSRTERADLAHAFLEAMPSPVELLPPLAVDEIRALTGGTS